MHCLLAVLSAPHDAEFDVQHLAKPVASHKCLLAKPHLKSFSIGGLDVEKGVPVAAFFFIPASSGSTDFVRVVPGAVPEAFSAFCSRAPPFPSLSNQFAV